MSFNSFYNANASYYTENYSIGEFKFGYELEGFYDKNDHEDLVEAINNAYDLDIDFDYTEAKGHPNWDSDCTIKADRSGMICVEFKSPPIYATPVNIQKTIKLINYLFAHGMKINDSCGFHIHISFPDINPIDTSWIAVQLSVNKWYEKIEHFQDIRMVDTQWASDGVFRELSSIIENSTLTKQNDIINYIHRSLFGDSASKYDLVGQHPQGTLEWRGPRGFADQGHKTVTDFFTKAFPMFVRYIVKALMEKELVYNNGQSSITKKEFTKIFSALDRRSPSEMTLSLKKKSQSASKKTFDTQMTHEEIVEVIKNNPWIAKGEFADLIIDSDGTMHSGQWKKGVFRGYVNGGEFDSRHAQLGSEAVWNYGGYIDDVGYHHISTHNQPSCIEEVK